MSHFDSYCESVILELDTTTPTVSAQPGQVAPVNPGIAPVDPSLQQASPDLAAMDINNPNHPVQAFVKTITTLPPQKQQEYWQKIGEMLKLNQSQH